MESALEAVERFGGEALARGAATGGRGGGASSGSESHSADADISMMANYSKNGMLLHILNGVAAAAHSKRRVGADARSGSGSRSRDHHR